MDPDLDPGGPKHMDPTDPELDPDPRNTAQKRTDPDPDADTDPQHCLVLSSTISQRDRVNLASCPLQSFSSCPP